MSLPYFKFMADNWLGGMICTHDMETQGIFINLCARLWKAGGEMDADVGRLSRVLRVDKQVLSNCLDLLEADGLISYKQNGLLEVCFISEQADSRLSLSAKRSIAGRKGGKAKAKRLPSNCQQPEPEPEPEYTPKVPKGTEGDVRDFSYVLPVASSGKAAGLFDRFLVAMRANGGGVNLNPRLDRAAWDRLVGENEALAAEIIAAVPRAACIQKTDKSKVPGGAKFLTDELWRIEGVRLVDDGIPLGDGLMTAEMHRGAINGH